MVSESEQTGLTQSDAERKPRKKARKAGRKKALKLSRFDKDVAKLIQSGVSSLSSLCLKLGVDRNAAKQRLDVLVEKGYLVLDGGNYGLGVEGYNRFAPKLKQVREKTQEKQDDSVDLSEVFSANVGVALEKPVPAKVADVNLSELMKKGAPSSAAKPFLPARPLGDNGEVCDLCRAGFKISVKDPSSGKFAHCVCGAAYHKDCYHALVDGGGKCARCGKKLPVILDKHGEESFKGIKDAFD
ncbi:hypothetical protein HZC09_04345 [Candidatus Micrarchaeota archaeon]|nr:hypothetical protein [Candidatus Micrarchaeota archaeon]